MMEFGYLLPWMLNATAKRKSKQRDFLNADATMLTQNEQFFFLNQTPPPVDNGVAAAALCPDDVGLFSPAAVPADFGPSCLIGVASAVVFAL
jgi:hypothetical protein